MTEPLSTTLRVVLSEDQGTGEIAVPLDTFLLFDSAITQELDTLERLLADWTTPNSLRRDIWTHLQR